MNNRWMKMSVLALSMSAITGTIYAEDQIQQPQVSGSNQVVADGTESSESSEATSSSSTTTDNTAKTSNVVDTNAAAPASNSEAHQAASALQKKEGDASQETNLQEVFTSNERQYSLIKKGVISSYYDLDYTYYRDSILDVALGDDDSRISRLRIREDAQHTLTNSFTAQYGVLDNLTLSATLPLVAKSDIASDSTTAGLGDIS